MPKADIMLRNQRQSVERPSVERWCARRARRAFTLLALTLHASPRTNRIPNLFVSLY